MKNRERIEQLEARMGRVEAMMGPQSFFVRSTDKDERGKPFDPCSKPNLVIIDDLEDSPPRPFRVGDVVRLEAWEGFDESARYEGRQGTIIRIGTGDNLGRVVTDIPCVVKHLGNMYWPASALTLIRAAGEPADCTDLEREVARLRGELKQAQDRKNDDRFMLLGEWNKAAAERDALKSPAQCWRSIVDVLNDIAPGWQAESDNHEQAAIAVICALKAERHDMAARAHGECQRANDWKGECEFHKDRARNAEAERDELRMNLEQTHNDNNKLLAENARITAERNAVRQQWKQLHDEVRIGFGERYTDGYTITRQLSDLCNELSAAIAERDGWKHEATRWEQLTSAAEAERDALRARIEDGVAGEMVDERRGERRKLQFVGHVSNSTGERIYPREGLGYQPASRTLHGKNDPRRTAGTRADRKL